MADNKENKVLNVPALRFPEFTGEWKSVHLEDGRVSEKADFIRLAKQ